MRKGDLLISALIVYIDCCLEYAYFSSYNPKAYFPRHWTVQSHFLLFGMCQNHLVSAGNFASPVYHEISGP